MEKSVADIIPLVCNLVITRFFADKSAISLSIFLISSCSIPAVFSMVSIVSIASVKICLLYFNLYTIFTKQSFTISSRTLRETQFVSLFSTRQHTQYVLSRTLWLWKEPPQSAHIILRANTEALFFLSSIFFFWNNSWTLSKSFRSIMATLLFSTKYIGCSPLFRTCRCGNVSVIYCFKNIASPLYREFVRIYRTDSLVQSTPFFLRGIKSSFRLSFILYIPIPLRYSLNIRRTISASVSFISNCPFTDLYPYGMPPTNSPSSILFRIPHLTLADMASLSF